MSFKQHTILIETFKLGMENLEECRRAWLIVFFFLFLFVKRRDAKMCLEHQCYCQNVYRIVSELSSVVSEFNSFALKFAKFSAIY